VEAKNIRLGADIAKTNQTRNVPINPTLMAWIETISPDDRQGKIVPSRWKQKAARVKKEASLDALELQDALRHSYGSYFLPLDQDLEALKAAMGHAHMSTFFKHYHTTFTREEALPYWEITPALIQASAAK